MSRLLTWFWRHGNVMDLLDCDYTALGIPFFPASSFRLHPQSHFPFSIFHSPKKLVGIATCSSMTPHKIVGATCYHAILTIHMDAPLHIFPHVDLRAWGITYTPTVLTAPMPSLSSRRSLRWWSASPIPLQPSQPRWSCSSPFSNP